MPQNHMNPKCDMLEIGHQRKCAAGLSIFIYSEMAYCITEHLLQGITQKQFGINITVNIS